MPATVEWCERRLLQRIHRYTIDAHRKSIKPVSLETYTEFLFDRHQLLPVTDSGSGESSGVDGQTRLQHTLNLLDGIAAPAASWEADLYPARINDYDPNWLDVLCISGKVAWGRYSLPASSGRRLNRKKNAGPVKSTPITLACRQNLDIWQALGRTQLDEDEPRAHSAVASRIEQDLRQHGASFFDQIQSRSGLLKTQLEEGLAELVSAGRISSDSFTGLRALLTPNHKKPGAHRRRGRRAMFGVEDAGRWSLLDTFQQGFSQEGFSQQGSSQQGSFSARAPLSKGFLSKGLLGKAPPSKAPCPAPPRAIGRYSMKNSWNASSVSTCNAGES